MSMITRRVACATLRVCGVPVNMLLLASLSATVLALLGAPRLLAQRPAALKLGAPAGTLTEEFVFVSSVRELSDGRALITDGRERRIVVADFRTGRVAPVGRQGKGPGEDTFVAPVHAISGDSSIMADLLQRRVLLLAGDSIVGQLSQDHPAVLATRGSFTGADARGHLLAVRAEEPPIGVTITDITDSASVLLVRRSDGGADTVARLRPRPRRIEQRANAEGRVTFSSTMPTGVLQSEEQALLFADGTLAVARLEPFRVDWRAPNGTWTRGARLPVPPIRVDARERAAFMERNASVYKPSESAAAAGLPQQVPPSARDFPANFPPFASATPCQRVRLAHSRCAVREVPTTWARTIS